MSSPFLRTLQTASAMMSALGEELCYGSCVEIDFDIGEHMKGPVIPEGVLKLTESEATQIVGEAFKFSLSSSSSASASSSSVASTEKAESSDITSSPSSSSSSSSSSSFTPFVKFSHGDSSHVLPSEPLEASGIRFLKAVERIYQHHIAAFSEIAQQLDDGTNPQNSTVSLPPNLLIVTHGFAPSQLLKLLYGRDSIDATRIFLCSMMCLQPFEGLSAKTQDFILNNVSSSSSSASSSSLTTVSGKHERDDGDGDKDKNGDASEHPQGLRPSFAVCWTRGVKWRIPTGQRRVLLPSFAKYFPKNADFLSGDLQQNASPGTSNFRMTSDGGKDDNVVGSGAGKVELSIATASDDEIFLFNPPYSPSAEEPDVNGVVEKTWYESRIVNPKAEEFHLGFTAEPESPPPLVPVAFNVRNSTRLSHSLVSESASG